MHNTKPSDTSTPLEPTKTRRTEKPPKNNNKCDQFRPVTWHPYRPEQQQQQRYQMELSCLLCARSARPIDSIFDSSNKTTEKYKKNLRFRFKCKILHLSSVFFVVGNFLNSISINKGNVLSLHKKKINPEEVVVNFSCSSAENLNGN